VKQDTPLLFVERVAFTYRDTPMELRRGYYRTDTHHYFNTLN
jgi:GntR family transcriptional regulator